MALKWLLIWLIVLRKKMTEDIRMKKISLNLEGG